MLVFFAVVGIIEEKEIVEPCLIIYVHRGSCVLYRYANKQLGKKVASDT